MNYFFSTFYFLTIFLFSSQVKAEERNIEYVNITEFEYIYMQINKDTNLTITRNNFTSWLQKWGFYDSCPFMLKVYRLNSEGSIPDKSQYNFGTPINNDDLMQKLFEKDEEAINEQERYAAEFILNGDPANLGSNLMKEVNKQKLAMLEKRGSDLKTGRIFDRLKREVLGEEIYLSKIPGGFYAKYTYKGPLISINEAWVAFLGEIQKSKIYHICDKPLLEIYKMSQQQSTLPELMTELYIPLESK